MTEQKRAFTPERLKDLEKRGLTMKGGGFPIEDVEDLRNAIQAIGRARDPQATRDWIISRAKDLGHEDLIPEGWESGPDNDADDDEGKGDWSGQIDHKVVPVSGFKVLNDTEGIVEAIVSVTGMEDRVKDTIEPGAYTKTLSERIPRGCWGHDWNVPISKTIAIKELLPGDGDLPKSLRSGQPWPANAGALMVQTQFNLDTQRGREAYSDVKFFGQDQEWSIGYNVPPGGATVDPKTGRRSIKQLVLHEYSPVLHGAMPEAVTQSVKDAQHAYAEMIERIEGKMLPGEDRGAAPAPKPKAKPAPSGGSSSSSLHPHQPAGSPKGGQFAPKSGGDSGSGSGKKAKQRKAVAAHAEKGGLTHTVKKGDTLWAIAAKMLGSGKRWKEIAAANGIKDPRKVPIGMALKIPGKAAPAKPAAKPKGTFTRVGTKPGDAAQMAHKIRVAAKVKDDGAVAEFVETPVEEVSLDVLLDNEPSMWDTIEAIVAEDFEVEIAEDLEDAANETVDAAVLGFEVIDDDDVEFEIDPATYDDLDLADFVPADTEDTDEDDEDGLLFGDGLSEEDIALLFDSPEVQADLEDNGIKADVRPGDGNAEVLRRYWAEGAGAAKIRWGSPGDFMRCVGHISKYMTEEQAKGYCNLIHHRSIGIWPAQHAAMMGKDDYPADGESKDVVGGAYPLDVAPGLAGADGSPKMVDVAAKPGDPCPECGDATDEQGHCMNPDCSKFGMAVKMTKAACAHPLDPDAKCDVPGCSNANAAATKTMLLGAVKGLLDDGVITLADLGVKSAPPVDEEDEDVVDDETAEEKVAITGDVLESVAFFADAEAKGYIRAGDGGWSWAGAEEKGIRDYVRDADGRFAHTSGGAQSAAQAISQRFAETNKRKPVATGGGQARKPHIEFPNATGKAKPSPIPNTSDSEVEYVNSPDGYAYPKRPPISAAEGARRRANADAARARYAKEKSALEVTQPIDHPDGGRLTRDGSTYRVDLLTKGAVETWEITDLDYGRSVKVDMNAEHIALPYRGSARVAVFTKGIDSLRGIQPAVKASANGALLATMAPASSLDYDTADAEIKSLLHRLDTERPAPDSLRSTLIRGRIADLSGGPWSEFKATEVAAVERARTIAITPAWRDRHAIPPMGEYDQWDEGQLAVAQDALVDTLNHDPDIPVDFENALKGELGRIVVEQQRRHGMEPTVSEKADSGEDLSGLTLAQIGEEAGKVLKAMKGGQNATPELRARLRALSTERKKRTGAVGKSVDVIDAETADLLDSADVDVLTPMEILEAERLLADLD